MDLPAFQYQQYGDGWNFWASTVNHAEKVIMWMVKKKNRDSCVLRVLHPTVHVLWERNLLVDSTGRGKRIRSIRQNTKRLGLSLPYEPMTAEAMVKYHIDCCEVFQEWKETEKFGRNLSVWMETGEKPLISWGQDECIYKQFTMTKKH